MVWAERTITVRAHVGQLPVYSLRPTRVRAECARHRRRHANNIRKCMELCLRMRMPARSKKQTCVALSTAEAEYMALASAAQEAMWLRQLIIDLKNEPVSATVIFEDNQSAICIAKNPQFHGRSNNKVPLHSRSSREQQHGAEILQDK